MQTYRLKSGITFWRTASGQLRVGNRFGNYLLPDQLSGVEIEPLLAELAFEMELDFDFEKYSSILSMLKELSLLDSKKTNRQISNSLIDTAQQNFLTRFEIEASSASRRDNILDGGTQNLLARQNFKISIVGEGNYRYSRVAVTTFTNLLASGFSKTEFRNSPLEFEAQVEISDLIGGHFALRDIGLSKPDLLRKSSAEISLFPQKRSVEMQVVADLIISIGPPHPHTQQESFEGNIPILVIDFVSGDEIRVGPLIVPGETPCFSCILLSEIEYGALSKIENAYFHGEFMELCSALAISGAGYLSMAVAEFADTGHSSLAGKTININMENFLNTETLSWQRHPNCACNWISGERNQERISTRA